MITPEEIVGEEWASWYRLSPQERWRESEKLWQVYFYLGGSLDTQPDTQSPFLRFGNTGCRRCSWAVRRAYSTAQPSLVAYRERLERVLTLPTRLPVVAHQFLRSV